ncbi:GTPase [Streptomyces blattellae]|uniref:GTPase n=1 Tax=Streptomyces blattellae TaxID=2569855 RepID=UPI0012B74257|nr:GTPase [Streptomyces blattellae]
MNTADSTRNTPADWPDRALAAVRKAVGDRAAAVLEGEWAVREADPDVTVVLYGPQNAGKTSLLRRLLAEDGTPVPAWATVSGGKETFGADAVRSAGLRYVDTPGVQAGDALHAERAGTALLEADALLLLLGRRLFGGAATDLLPLVTGEAVDPDHPRPFPAGALLPVVCKADLWGKGADSDEFAEEADLTREDFRHQLAARMDERRIPDLHVVVADYATLSARIDPTDLRREHFLSFGERDGVEALRAGLRALPARRAELRAGARVRFWCRHAARALDGARIALAEAEAARDGARRVDARFALLESRLDAVRETGRVELRAAVREELLRAADSAASAESAEETARKRLATAVRGWQARWTGEVQRLVLQGRAEAVTVRTAPGMRAFHAYIDDIRAVLATADRPAPARSAAPDVTTAVVLGLGPLAHVVTHELRRRRQEHIGEAVGQQQNRTADPGAGQGADAVTAGQTSAVSDPYAYAYAAYPVPDAPGLPGHDGPEAGTGGFSDSDAAASGPADTSTVGGSAVGDAVDGGATTGGPAADGTAAGDVGVGDTAILLGEQALVIAVSEIRDLVRRKRAEQAEQRRAERREAAEKATERIAAKLEGPWLRALERARAGIRAQRPDTATTALAESELAQLDGAVKELEKVLREVPL